MADTEGNNIKEMYVKEFLLRYMEARQSLSSDFGHLYIGNFISYLRGNCVDALYDEIMVSYEKSKTGETGRRTKLIVESMHREYVEEGKQMPYEISKISLDDVLQQVRKRESRFLMGS